jgi:outer membrane lipopolysaccharide assembly protein LptE/RlpB
MKKIINLVFLLTLLTLISQCSGYKPIFASANIHFKISNHLIEGNKIIGNKIYAKLLNLSKSKKNKKGTKNIDIIINVSKNKKTTSKDSAGKNLEYKITLNSKIIVKDNKNNNELINHTFVSTQSYKIQDQYSDTLALENQSIENLINKTYQELLIKLSENIILR